MSCVTIQDPIALRILGFEGELPKGSLTEATYNELVANQKQPDRCPTWEGFLKIVQGNPEDNLSVACGTHVLSVKDVKDLEKSIIRKAPDEGAMEKALAILDDKYHPVTVFLAATTGGKFKTAATVLGAIAATFAIGAGGKKIYDHLTRSSNELWTELLDLIEAKEDVNQEKGLDDRLELIRDIGDKGDDKARSYLVMILTDPRFSPIERKESEKVLNEMSEDLLQENKSNIANRLAEIATTKNIQWLLANLENKELHHRIDARSLFVTSVISNPVATVDEIAFQNDPFKFFTYYKEKVDDKSEKLKDHHRAYIRGRIAEHEEDFERAAGHYLAAINFNPQFAEAHFRLGVCYLENSKDKMALKSIREAINIDPSLTVAWRRAVTLALRTNDFEIAKKLLAAVVSKYKANFSTEEFSFYEGLIELSKGENGAVIKRYESLVAKLKSNSNDHYLLDATYYNLGNAYLRSEGQKNYHKAKECFESALQILDKYPQKDNPDYLDLYSAVCVSFAKTLKKLGGDLALKAIDYLEKALKHRETAEAHVGYANYIQAYPEDFKEHLHKQAVPLFAGIHAEASIHYQKALEKNPKHPLALYNLALLHIEKKENEEARGYLESIVKNNNADNRTLSDTYATLADLEIKNRRWDSALGKAKLSLQEDPKNYIAYWNIGEAYEGMAEDASKMSLKLHYLSLALAAYQESQKRCDEYCNPSDQYQQADKKSLVQIIGRIEGEMTVLNGQSKSKK